MPIGYYIRFALTSSLALLMAGVALFAYAPLFGDAENNPLLWQEVFLAVLAGIGMLWTFSHGTNLPFPLSRWCYVYDAVIASLVGLAFAIMVTDVSSSARAFALISILGVITFASTMHFLDGGNRVSYFTHQRERERDSEVS